MLHGPCKAEDNRKQRKRIRSSSTLAALHRLLRNLRRSGGGFGALGLLLLTLLLLLLRLRLRNRRLSRSRTLSSSLLTHSLDSSDVSTDNPALVLHGAARALLGNLLGDTLLMHAAVDLCPCDLTGVLALEEEGGILGGGEAEDLGVAADEELALGGVDFEAGERVNLDLLLAHNHSAIILAEDQLNVTHHL